MKIRRRKNPGGSISWQLNCGLINGKRVQISFSTKEAAEAERELRMKKLRLHGESSFSLSEDERIRFSAARDRLAAVGASIEAAVEYYLAARPNLRPPEPLSRLVELCVSEMEGRRKRPRYIKQFQVVCRSFLAGRENCLATAVTRDEVKAWLYGNGWAPKTQRGYLGDLRTLFSWAKRERYVATNPCLEIPLAAQEDSEIQIFGAAECERLLLLAATYHGPMWDRSLQRWRDGYRFLPLVGYAVIATYVGVRPEEVQRIPRSDLDLATGTLRIAGKHAKTRQRRAVELPECALGWLEMWAKSCPGDWIIPCNFTRLWRHLREMAGLIPWPHDVLRHTCASMHYALHQDEGKIKALLGHSKDEETFFRHYRGLRLPDGRTLTRAEAEKFYSIVCPGRISPKKL